MTCLYISNLKDIINKMELESSIKTKDETIDTFDSQNNYFEINKEVKCLISEMLENVVNEPNSILNKDSDKKQFSQNSNYLSINKIEKESFCEVLKTSTDQFQKDYFNINDNSDESTQSSDVEKVVQEVMDITDNQLLNTFEKLQEDCVITITSEKEQNDQPTEINEQNILNHYDWTSPKLISQDTLEFQPSKYSENFTKGCFWSPDGTCLLIPSEDYRIRILELPQQLYSEKCAQKFISSSFESVLKVKEGGTIYDTCWYPFMNSWDPVTCCFLSTSQETPIHLWDAFTGELRATYRAYNLVDEVEAAISVQFTDSGTQVWSGFKNALRNFDTNRPGRQINTIFLKKDFPNVTGLVSCIRENPAMHGLLAFGTYSKNIGLYKDGPLCSFKTANGVTQIEFSPCGTKLYSAIRRGSEFLCWDLRNPGTVLYSFLNRQADTNQRINFCGSDFNEIISGGIDGCVRVWKIPSEIEEYVEIDPIYKIKITKDCINGVSLHNSLPILAVSTGSRILEESENKMRDNSVRLYWLKKMEHT